MNADELSRLFDAERVVRPPIDGMERGLSRLLADVAEHAAPLPIAMGSLKLGLSTVSKWVISGFVLGLLGAGAASQIWSTSAAGAPSSYLMTNATTSDAAQVTASPAALPVELAEKAAEIPVRGAARLAASALPSASAPAVDATTFDEELRLISAAKSELERGQASSAAAWLGEHAQRFPNGVFALDREALEILVSCSKRKQPGLAQAFVANHSNSPMVARLLRVCGQRDSAAPSASDFSEIVK